MSLIRRIDLRGADAAPVDYRASVPRAEFDVEAATHQVQPILDAVRARGVEAITEFSVRFDGVEGDDIAVPRAALTTALERLDPAVRAGLEESIRRLRATCAAELERDVTSEVAPGATVTHRKVPIDRVGLYVPGGLAPLVSSVVMNVVPAQVAGVRSIALASPPQKNRDGLPEPTILAACELLGVEEVYAVGGAQAIAMFAYGAGPCERVDLVTGPGNIYVAAAKRLLRGVVGIDSEAGPTEIAILADDSADAAFVAADMVSQAEHDPMAASVLVTDSLELADAVEAELDKQVFATRHTERIRTALGGRQSGIVLVDDMDQGVDVVDAYAAEHLEVVTRDAAAHAARVRNAGAIFVGPWSPVSLGDYCAGSNHVLPTAGCACHSSGLSVRAFTKSVHVIDYSREALPEAAADIARAVGAAAASLNRYPDREFVELRSALAAYLDTSGGSGITPEMVWAANGSNEVMLQLLQAFGGPGRVALSFAPTYSMYPEYARDTMTEWVAGHRAEDFSLDLDAARRLVEERRPSVVLLPSPNNPTGTALPPEAVTMLCQAAASYEPGGIVVVDEAYGEFRRAGTPSALELLPRHRNLVVTRTMSKAFALAGARLGYLAADPSICDAIRVVRLPYHLSAVTQATALAALRHAPELLGKVDELRAERDATVDWLREQGFEVADSDANFALFGTFADRHAVWQGLVDRGVLVRETGPDGWLRVSIGTPAEMAAFEKALVEVTEEGVS